MGIQELPTAREASPAIKPLSSHPDTHQKTRPNRNQITLFEQQFSVQIGLIDQETQRMQQEFDPEHGSETEMEFQTKASNSTRVKHTSEG